LHESSLPHFLLNGWISANVEQHIEADIEKLILLPDENIEFFELRPGCNTIIFIIFAPHFDVLTVHEVKPLDLVLQYFHDSRTHFVLCEYFLKLLVVGEDVEGGQDVYA
jgi:hypothetical protein